MRLIRRESHPERGPMYELQTYECAGCGNILKANVSTPHAG